MADLNGIDMSFISEALKNKIDAIKGMEGDTAKVDSAVEGNALAELLANTSGTEQQKYIQAHLQEYEEYLQEQERLIAQEQEQDFLSRVSDRAKNYVKQVAKMFGDEEKIDEKAEVHILGEALNDDRYSEEDKRYIMRALKESGLNEGPDGDESKDYVANAKPSFGIGNETAVSEKSFEEQFVDNSRRDFLRMYPEVNDINREERSYDESGNIISVLFEGSYYDNKGHKAIVNHEFIAEQSVTADEAVPPNLGTVTNETPDLNDNNNSIFKRIP